MPFNIALPRYCSQYLPTNPFTNQPLSSCKGEQCLNCYTESVSVPFTADLIEQLQSIIAILKTVVFNDLDQARNVEDEIASLKKYIVKAIATPCKTGVLPLNRTIPPLMSGHLFK